MEASMNSSQQLGRSVGRGVSGSGNSQALQQMMAQKGAQDFGVGQGYTAIDELVAQRLDDIQMQYDD